MTTQELHGVAHELKFWQRFVKTERFLKGWVGNQPTPELNPWAKDFILQQMPAGARILDVGSGVVSILNGLRHDLQVTTADPLGELYGLVFDYARYGIAPPLPIPSEELNFPQQFDMVHCSNALDHTQKPSMAFNAMANAVVLGGWLMVQGFCNEADAENWQGFHQWNIDIRECDGALSITGEAGEVWHTPPADMHRRMKLDTGKDWFIYCWKRKNPMGI